MHIHILGICGTFMGGLALLAKQLGHNVSGSDVNIYPPMSTLLESSGIGIIQDYSPLQLSPAPDIIVVGNTIPRGNECVEHVLDTGLEYTSGPQWLYEHVLKGQHVLAVSGTHGKTTTSSMLAWMLESAGKQPGFLIGGVVENFDVSARLGANKYFVVEADEYDTAFFDKRSKFVHYHPSTLVINNLEFDHADIFDSLVDIKRQFHHLIRTLPSQGKIIARDKDKEIDSVLDMGCWTPCDTFGLESGLWTAEAISRDFSHFHIFNDGKVVGELEWQLIGRHNAENALAAIAAANNVGVEPQLAISALTEFKSVKRRLQKLASIKGVTIYDDFAHHPTEIKTTLEGLRHSVSKDRIVTVLEPRSNTMRMGIHKHLLGQALSDSDQVLLYQPPDLSWDLELIREETEGACWIYTQIDELLNALIDKLRSGSHVVIMSNGGFENIHQRLIDRLQDE